MSNTNNPPLEKSIQSKILKYLRSKGLFVWRNNAGSIPVGSGKYARRVQLGPSGLPDILGYLPTGQGFGIEVKRSQNSKASETQFLKIKSLKEIGVPVFVAWDMEVVQFIFDDPLLTYSRLHGACDTFLATYKHRVKRKKYEFDPDLPFL